MGVLFLSNTPIVQIKEIKPNKRITHCVLVLIRLSGSFGCPKSKKNLIFKLFEGVFNIVWRNRREYFTLNFSTFAAC